LTTRSLEGRVALVTGAGRNIGRGVALLFAREGAAVVVNTRRNEQDANTVAAEIADAGGRALAVTADVSVPSEVTRMVARSVDEFGKVDLLVNAAAHRVRSPFLELTEEDWRRTMSVALDGGFHCTQQVLPSMIESGGGSVIYFVGKGAFLGGPERAHTAASKMALVGMCRSLATEFAPHNIRFNVIAPGRVATDRPADEAPDEHFLEPNPMGRDGTVEDIARGCLFLASDQSSWMTGQVLHLNGGAYYG